MEGNVRYLSEYLRGATKLIIPVYQRNYDWKKENCKRLMDDLISLEKENKNTHFFGSIVVKPGDFSQEIIVIDGQQRLTTTSLLLLAMKNWMQNNNIQGDRINPTNVNDIFLEDSFSRDVDKYKLKPNPRDFQAYKKLFSDEKFYIKNSNITMNYEYFYSMLNDLPISLDKLMNSIQKLQIMVVNLNSPEDDPQLIFESLNSTGVDLTDADKIRNFLLMNEKQDSQLFYFENYWEPIEERTHFQLSAFFRDYLTVKNGKYPNISKVYEVFIDFYKDKCKDKKEFFDELSNYSFAYKQILEGTTKSRKINEILNRFNELQVTVIRPFLIAILHDYNHDKLSEEDVVGSFSVLETYLARRMITKMPSNSLNKVIATLYRDIVKLFPEDGETSSLTDIISYLLLSKTNTAKLPNDEEVIDSLKQNDFYNINSAFRTYLFERLENFDHVEALQIYQGVKNQEYSVEHIMPQKLSGKWVKELGDNYKRIHQSYLNSLGNLTLTGYNSKYSNKSFEEKQTMEKGFKQSHFVNLNKIPAHANQWGENEMIQRVSELIKTALNIWPYPEAKFVPSSEETKMIVFDGEQHFTGYQIKGYSFVTDEYQPVTTWKDFFINIIKQLTEINMNPMVELAKINSQSGLEGIFSNEPNAVNSEVIGGLYVFTSLSNWRKMNYIKQLLDLYKIDYDALMIDAVLYESKNE